MQVSSGRTGSNTVALTHVIVPLPSVAAVLSSSVSSVYPGLHCTVSVVSGATACEVEPVTNPLSIAGIPKSLSGGRSNC